MKNILSLFFFLSFSTISFAQTNDESLLNSYSKEELTQLKNAEPEKYEILIYALDHGTYVSEYNLEKHGQLKLKELPNIDKIPSFTDLNVKIESFNQYFYAPKLNKMVVVKSEWVLNFEKSKEK
jgi:hypothetical protein